MLVFVSNMCIQLRRVDVVVLLDIVHSARLNCLDGLLSKGENCRELGMGSDGVKGRKETGVARQQG